MFKQKPCQEKMSGGSIFSLGLDNPVREAGGKPAARASLKLARGDFGDSRARRKEQMLVASMLVPIPYGEVHEP